MQKFSLSFFFIFICLVYLLKLLHIFYILDFLGLVEFPYWFKAGFFAQNFGNFPVASWKNFFMQGEIQYMRGQIQHRKAWTTQKSGILIWNFMTSWMFGSIGGEKDHFSQIYI